MSTPHQQAEAQLTAYALTLPETDVATGWARWLRVTGKTFAVFGAKEDRDDALTITLKLPISFEMIQDLPFVRESRGWHLQHKWAIVHFAADDDILAEIPTLEGWLRQSYRAMAPKRLGRLVEEPRG
ncbi:MAG TPA: hypothetical protein VIO94_01735 [Phenylobacterium sp.]